MTSLQRLWSPLRRRAYLEGLQYNTSKKLLGTVLATFGRLDGANDLVAEALAPIGLLEAVASRMLFGPFWPPFGDQTTPITSLQRFWPAAL